MRPTHRAFTLIELLVVISIFAILAALVFPVFARSRAMARKTVCLSNFKQMMLAVQMYTQDYDETYPIAGNGYISCDNPGDLLQIIIQPYARSDDLWLCPEDPASRQRREASL